MVFVADDLAAWLVFILAEAGRKGLASLVLGTDQQRALRAAAAAAVQRTATELRPHDAAGAEHLALVINQIFSEPLSTSAISLQPTLIQFLQAGVADQLAPLSDASLTGLGISAAEALELSASTLADKLTGHLVREIVFRGAAGGPLTPFAGQLNDDVTHMQSQRIEAAVQDLADELKLALAQLENLPRLGVAPAITHTLPADIASFTGRTSELKLLTRIVRDSQPTPGVVPIVSIDGMAGVGKTAFAVHAAHQFAELFPDGQLFVRLFGHALGESPAEPRQALVSLLLEDGVAPQHIPDGLEECARLWRNRRFGRKTLLLLDDAASAEQIRPLLPANAGNLVLITSRHRLTALADAQRLTLDILDSDMATQMFARLVNRPDVLPGDRAVTQIVELCGRVPLAISLVAGQLKHHDKWTADSVAKDLGAATNRLSVLTAENVSIGGAIELSYRGVPTEEQHLFRQIGQAPGPDFDVYAAAAANGTDLITTRVLLNNLFGCHLIEEQEFGRYRLHDLVREHARMLLANDELAPESEIAVHRLLDYYLQTARAGNKLLMQRTPIAEPTEATYPPAHSPVLATREEALAWMTAERLNLQASIGDALARGRLSQAVALSTEIHAFLRIGGYWTEALSLDAVLVQAARSSGDSLAECDILLNLGDMQYLTGDYSAAAQSLTSALELSRDHGSQGGEANALCLLGIVQQASGDYASATSSLLRSLDLSRATRDRAGQANAYGALGVVQQATGDYSAAIDSQERALAMYRQVGDQKGVADAFNCIGAVEYLTGDFPSAATHQEMALELYGRLGSRLGESNALYMLAGVQLSIGNYPAAISNLMRSIEQCRELGSQLGQASSLYMLGGAQRLTGEYDAAATNLSESLDIYRLIGDQNGIADVLIELGAVRRLTGDYAAAATHLTDALQLSRELGSGFTEASTLIELGTVRHVTGDCAGAAADLADALRLSRELGIRAAEAEALNNMGEVSLTADSPSEAMMHYEQALAIATEIALPLEMGRALEGIGRCHLRQQRPSMGEAFLREALGLYREIASPRASEVDAMLLDRRQ